MENFCVCTENFQPTKEIDKMYFMTFLKLKHELKSIWNDCRKRYDKRKRFGVCESLKGGLLFESYPK
jgi:hypothetical protein